MYSGVRSSVMIFSKPFMSSGWEGHTQRVLYYSLEKQEDKERGILILYALPDTKKLHLTEAQAYDIIWSAFQDIQKEAFSAIVFYGQDTGIKSGKGFDELGVLLPIHQFESNMLHHMRAIDGLVLSCREEMIKLAGSNSLDLTSE